MKLKFKNYFSLQQSVVLLFLLLAGINLFNMHYYFIFFVFTTCIILNNRCLKLNTSFLFLLLFSINYFIFEVYNGLSITGLIKQFTYPMCYLLGLNFFQMGKNRNMDSRKDFQALYALAIIAIGPFFHYILNMYKNIDSLYRNNVDFWTGKVLSATGQAAFAIMAVALFSSILFSKNKTWVKIASVFGLVYILAYNMVLAGRTLIFLFVLILITAFLYSVVQSQTKRRISIIVVTIIIIVLVTIIYANNYFGVREWLLGSNLSARFDVINIYEDTRIDYKIMYIKNMLNFPFGGDMIFKTVGGYAHELYLDVYNDIGCVGYFSIIIYMVNSCNAAVKLIKSNEVCDNLRIMILCLYLAIILEFLIEPIVQGLPWMLNLFCFISGTLTALINSMNKIQRR